MKLSTILTSLLLGCTISTLADGRETVNLDGNGWRLWMDRAATWQDDTLYLPYEARDLSRLPVNAPTIGWEALYNNAEAVSVSVPGTVEEYLTVSAAPQPTDFQGVSWWTRTVRMPSDLKGRRVLLSFESVRMRAEVYLDGQLVAYDCVGESPFQADITPYVQAGQTQQLAVRVTNPGGNFHWQDFTPMRWGRYSIPPGRAFGGIIGRVRLDCVAEAHITDVYMQNTPEVRTVNCIVTLCAPTDKSTTRTLDITVSEKDRPERVVYTTRQKVTFAGDSTVVSIPMTVSNARLWSPDDPALYTCRVELKQGRHTMDNDQRTFGFRWFAPDGIGSDAVLRLNGQRVMLRSAISWGYFPATGLHATRQMAERQVQVAKQLGLNMLNFHRSIGSPIVLEAADSIGLLYYEEPGAFHSAPHDAFHRALVNEKLQRMVRRDRSHPALVIYNLINEFGGPLTRDTALVAKRMNDMRRAHALDPSRVMTFTSGWAARENSDEDSKANMQPFDTTLYRRGWFDNHRAGGPATYEEGYYRGPRQNYMYTDNRTEVYMRGEEGAISTPPRVELIAHEIDSTGRAGWDGRFWQRQYDAFRTFMAKKGLYKNFSSVDDLTRLLGNVQMEHQGRRIQSMRMQNVGDCYVINGWESMPYDNHSGVVDIYRNPKGDVDRLAYYNQPLYVAVATRNQVVRTPGEAHVDFYVVNERDVKGTYQLTMRLKGANGQTVSEQKRTVNVAGGDMFGQLLAEDISISLPAEAAMYRVEGELADADGHVIATGHDEILGVSWSADDLQGRGAYYGLEDDKVAQFYREQTGHDLMRYTDDAPQLDWIAVTRSLLDEPVLVSPEFFVPGTLHATWYDDDDIRSAVGTKDDADINRTFADGAQPDALVPANQMFSVIWEGDLMPRESGMFLLGVSTDRGVRLDADGLRLVDCWGNNNDITESRPLVLQEGKAVHIRLEYRQTRATGHVGLVWTRPGNTGISTDRLFERIARDGTTLILLDKSETWMKAVADHTGTRYDGFYAVGSNWVGGVHFVRRHPLFSGLPTDDAMSWPYQAVVRDGDNRFGFIMEGEELAAGSYRSWPFHLGTAVGVVPCGRGNVVFSTLDIANQLLSSEATAEVARRLLCNYIGYHKHKNK